MYFLEGRKPGLRLYAFSRRVNDNVRVPLLSWFPSVLTELSQKVKDKVRPPLLSWCPKVLAELEATHFHFRVHLFHRRMVAYVAAHTPPLHPHRKASWRLAGRLLELLTATSWDMIGCRSPKKEYCSLWGIMKLLLEIEDGIKLLLEIKDGIKKEYCSSSGIIKFLLL